MAFLPSAAHEIVGSQAFGGAHGHQWTGTTTHSHGSEGATTHSHSRRRTIPPTARTGTVVVIDDSATTLTVISQWLEEDGYRVVPLSRALGATTTLLRVRPNVLLLDIQLPGLSGDRFAHILSENPATASIPIIFHSQIDPVELRRLAHECAVVGAIAKSSSHVMFSREFEKLAAPFLNDTTDDADTASPKGIAAPVSTGIAEIDVQHRHIKELSARIAESLRDAKEAGERFSTRRDIRAKVLELLVFMRFHLAMEDRYLRERELPFMKEHRVRHDAYLDDTASIEKTVDMEISAAELLECGRRIRLLALEHLWSTDPEDFYHGKRSC